MRSRTAGARRPLGEMLVERGLLTADQLAEALAAQPASGERLGEILARLGYVRRCDLFRTLADQMGVPFHDLGFSPTSEDLAYLLPRHLAERIHAIPVARGDGALRVAMADPADLLALDDLARALLAPVEPVLADPQAIDVALRGFSERPQSVSFRSFEEATPYAVDNILASALRVEATIIHVWSYADDSSTVVSCRRDGQDKELGTFPPSVSIVYRLRTLAGLKPAAKGQPQDAIARMSVDGKDFDLHLAVVPWQDGQLLALRIRPPALVPRTPDQEAALRHAVWATALQALLVALVSGQDEQQLRESYAAAGWSDEALTDLWELVPPRLEVLAAKPAAPEVARDERAPRSVDDLIFRHAFETLAREAEGVSGKEAGDAVRKISDALFGDGDKPEPKP